MMSNKKIMLVAVATAATALLGGFVLFAYYNFTHNFLKFTPQQVADVEIALKGAMGEAFFSGQKSQVGQATDSKAKQGLDALFAPTPVGNNSQGLIEEYRKDPQKFKHYAQMVDTAMNAKQVSDAILRQDLSPLPRTSEPLGIEAKLKLDAWGRPFCIIPAGERMAVVSGGPSHLSCEALPLTAEQIAKSNRSLYAGPSDVIVFVAMRPRRPLD